MLTSVYKGIYKVFKYLGTEIDHVFLTAHKLFAWKSTATTPPAEEPQGFSKPGPDFYSTIPTSSDLTFSISSWYNLLIVKHKTSVFLH